MIITPQARALLEAPLSTSDAVNRLGRALWLYHWLLVNANTRGIVLRTDRTIAKALGVSEDEILEWLRRLADAGLVTPLSPPPHLVIKLPTWSGVVPLSGQNGVETAVRQDSDFENPVQPYVRNVRDVRDVRHVAENKNKQNTDVRHGEGGPGEGGSDLLAEIRDVIGEDDGLDDLFTRFPEAVISRALTETKAKPAGEIRKSRAALFFHLLARYNRANLDA